MARVVVVTLDVVPLDGGPATGAGLRAMGLGEGLRLRGHDVVYAMQEEHRARLGSHRGVRYFADEGLDAAVDSHDPDVVVFQHWPIANALGEEHRARIAIDFHGPLLLETLYNHPPSVAGYVPDKLRALARADFFSCASRRQLYYYAAFLLASGFDLREPPMAVVPFSMPPELPERNGWPSPPVFVYGGVLLPWQDPSTGLEVLVGELEAAGEGELRMYGGPHPWIELASEGRIAELEERLGQSERVTFPGMLSRTELVGEYTRSTVAWDLMARNVEREMAFTSRTVEYLWCGLPVVYNDYSELSERIARADAGWIVDPADAEAIRAVAREVLADPAEVRRKGENARRLVGEELTWEASITPLDDFCRAPRPAARLEGRPFVVQPGTLPPAGNVVRSGASSLRSLVGSALPDPVRRVVRRLLRRPAA